MTGTMKNISTKALLCLISLTFFSLSLSLLLITPFPLSSFPLLPTFDLLHSSPVFSVLKSCLNFCLCFSILCVLPSPLLCLPEAGEDDVWVQLVGCPGRAAGVVPAGHLLLWSWRTQPAAAEHGESTDAGGSSSNQPHQKALCFVSLAQHCGWFNIEICHMTFHRWWMILYFYTFSTRLFTFIFELIYWLHWPVFQLQAWPGWSEWAAQHCDVSERFDDNPHVQWRFTSPQRGHEGVLVQR